MATAPIRAAGLQWRQVRLPGGGYRQRARSAGSPGTGCHEEGNQFPGFAPEPLEDRALGQEDTQPCLEQLMALGGKG